MEITDFCSIAGDKRRAGSLMTNVYGVRCRKCLWRRRNKIAGQERSDNGRWRKFAGEDLVKIAGEDDEDQRWRSHDGENHCWRFGEDCWWISLLDIWRSKTKVTDEYGLMVKIAERKSPQKIWWRSLVKINSRSLICMWRSVEHQWFRIGEYQRRRKAFKITGGNWLIKSMAKVSNESIWRW